MAVGGRGAGGGITFPSVVMELSHHVTTPQKGRNERARRQEGGTSRLCLGALLKESSPPPYNSAETFNVTEVAGGDGLKGGGDGLKGCKDEMPERMQRCLKGCRGQMWRGWGS